MDDLLHGALASEFAFKVQDGKQITHHRRTRFIAATGQASR
jgi:hypothetical protein